MQHMTVMGSLPRSERIARSLLKAWGSGEPHRLRNEVSQIAGTDCCGLSAFEQERFEIVQQVAKTIGVWIDGARSKHADLNVALSLLRHVAMPKDTAA